jgi:hypothetical protein
MGRISSFLRRPAGGAPHQPPGGFAPMRIKPENAPGIRARISEEKSLRYQPIHRLRGFRHCLFDCVLHQSPAGDAFEGLDRGWMIDKIVQYLVRQYRCRCASSILFWYRQPSNSIDRTARALPKAI